MGGGYVVYSDGRFEGGPITSVEFTNNRMGYGRWGHASINQSELVWDSNVDDLTGAEVDP
jgi:hypothetical protein